MENIQQIQELLFDYIKDNTYKDSSSLDFKTLLFVEGLLDSMGFVLLLDFVEETFKISPTDSDLVEANFESIDAITNFLLRKKIVAA